MVDSNEFRAAVDKIAKDLHEFAEGLPAGERQQWLRVLHDMYARRYEDDNTATWSILAGASVATFAGLVAIDKPTLAQVITLGLISFGLAFHWLLITENHRLAQSNSLAWQVAIQEFIGIKDPLRTAATRPKWMYPFASPLAVRIWRVLLLLSITLAWTLAGVFVEYF